MAKSDKMYKNSPTVKRDESGKVGIKRPSEADGEDMGTAGDNVAGDQGSMPIDAEQVEQTHDRHQTEMKDMHKRHQDETKDMHKRHAKEISKHFGKEGKE